MTAVTTGSDSKKSRVSWSDSGSSVALAYVTGVMTSVTTVVVKVDVGGDVTGAGGMYVATRKRTGHTPLGSTGRNSRG